VSIAATSSAEVAVAVEVDGRWDALALSQRLVPFHSFLVQETPKRWVVHARAPGWHGETIADALLAIEEWRSLRSLDARVRVGALPDGGG
jgi:hypothetical protein